MTVTYSLTAEDFLRANRRHCALIGRTPRAWILPTMAGLVWAWALLAGRDWPPEAFAAAFAALTALVAGAVWLLMMGVNALALRRSSRRLYKQTRALHVPFQLTWDDAEIRWSSERSEQRVPWSDFVKWTGGEEGLMLYISDAMFFVLPSREVPPEAQEEIWEQLLAHDIPEWRPWQASRRLGERR